MFKGSIVALITPYKDDQIDVQGLVNLCEWHVQSGTKGIVICGSTGEASLLTHEERDFCIRTALDTVKGRLPIIVGCGSPSTAETLKMVQHAEKLGAAAALIVTPYYVKPSQDGIYQHFSHINNCTGIPLLVYNNPGRACADISIETMLRLFELKNVVGLKDSSPDVTRATKLKKACAADICLLSGDDPTCTSYLLSGGVGMISVTANVAPKLNQAIVDAFEANDLPLMQRLNEQMMDLFYAMFIETNPAPAKFGVHALHKTANTVRLPLLPIKKTTEDIILSEFKKLKLI